jgi:hypothetical protein
MEYISFKKNTYQEMIDLWRNPQRLSYIITVSEINDILKKDTSLTTEKIIEDFRKYPLVREVCMSLGQIIIFPK